MRTTWMLQLPALVVALCLTACGDDTESRARQSDPNSSDLTQLRCGGTTSGGSALTQGGTPAMRAVPADQLRFMNGDLAQSMCDLMRERNKPLTLFHFVSVKCYSCMKWTESLTAGLEELGVLTSVQPVVVMTDRVETLSEDEARRLKRDVARKAVWVLDYYGEMNAFFSPSDTGETAPLVVAVDSDARGFYIDDASLGARAVVQMASDMMELGIRLPAAPAP